MQAETTDKRQRQPTERKKILANDIIDGPAVMAVKSHLRNSRPVVIAISTNNALSGAAENIGRLLNRKNKR